jgi:type VI secretion system secreted protein VgrG
MFKDMRKPILQGMVPTFPATQPADTSVIERPSSGGLLGVVVGSAAVVTLVFAAVLSLPSRAGAAEDPILLGTASDYSVLAGSTVTNTGPTTLGESLGLHPGSATPGFPPGLVGGARHVADAKARQAKTDLKNAWNDAGSRATTTGVAGDLVGRTLLPGVYTSSGPLAVSGALTLNALGNPRSVFIFRIAKTLITASASRVLMTNGAQACNVWWQVGSSATLGTHSSFIGTVMAMASVTVTTGVRVEGRALARSGAVTLDTDTFVSPGCDLTTGSSAAGSSSASSTSGTGTSTATTGGTTTTGSTSGTGTTAGTGTTGSTGPASGTTTAPVRGVLGSSPARTTMPGPSATTPSTPGESSSASTTGPSHGNTTQTTVRLSRTGQLVGQLILGSLLLLGLGAALLTLGRRRAASRHR